MMQRILLITGIAALCIALLLTVAPYFLRPAPRVEVFPIDPETLELPASTSAPVPGMGATPTPSPVRTRMPSLVTLQQGVDDYDGCSDTYIQFYLPNDNFCNSHTVSVRAGNKACMLLRFDFTRLPAKAYGLGSDSIVQHATLSLFVVQGRADTQIGIYRLRRPWEPCLTTWNLPWQKPGADGLDDREMEPRAELTTTKAQGWLEFDVTGLVQDWLQDAEHNYGMLVKSFESRWPSHEIIFSSDHPAASSRPKLTIKYEPAPPTSTPPPVTATSTPTPEPTLTPTATPTAPPIRPLGPRVVEWRWREVMNIGNPYKVVAVFRPATPPASSAPIPLPALLSIEAHLTAPSFTIVNDSAQEQALGDANGSLTWSWTITPRIVGSQIMSLDLNFTWKPVLGARTDSGVWYETRVVKVEKAWATWAQLNMARNWLALLGVLCIVGYLVLKRQTS